MNEPFRCLIDMRNEAINIKSIDNLQAMSLYDVIYDRYGCAIKLVNKMILENAKTKQKHLSTAWIDYNKAFDSVPHSWILRCLETFKVSPIIINCRRTSMKLWETNCTLSNSNVLTANDMCIKCGFFQGKSLSPLLFCMALIPLSRLLNDTGYGYKISNKKINHLFYMYDLKLYACCDYELEGLLKTVKHLVMILGWNLVWINALKQPLDVENRKVPIALC